MNKKGREGREGEKERGREEKRAPLPTPVPYTALHC